MGNGMYCSKLKSSKLVYHLNKDKNISKNDGQLSNNKIIEKMKNEFQNDLNSNSSLEFLTGIELNTILLSASHSLKISTLMNLIETNENYRIINLSNKIYNLIINQEKNLNFYNQKNKKLFRMIETMRTILDEKLSKIAELDLKNLQYPNIPLKYLEIMIEVFQIILTYQTGNLINESHVWWSKEKYGENLQFYDSKFIDLAGKIKYEIEYWEKSRVRTNKSPIKKISVAGYGIKRVLMKKNTDDIRDVSANILKDKEDLLKIVRSYLNDLNEYANLSFIDRIKTLKEKTENIEDDVGDLDSQPHKIPQNMFICGIKRKK